MSGVPKKFRIFLNILKHKLISFLHILLKITSYLFKYLIVKPNIFQTHPTRIFSDLHVGWLKKGNHPSFDDKQINLLSNEMLLIYVSLQNCHFETIKSSQISIQWWEVKSTMKTFRKIAIQIRELHLSEL